MPARKNEKVVERLRFPAHLEREHILHAAKAAKPLLVELQHLGALILKRSGTRESGPPRLVTEDLGEQDIPICVGAGLEDARDAVRIQIDKYL